MVTLTKKLTFDRAFVQNYVGFANFQKGESYVGNRAISQGKLKNWILSALCQGQEFDPYRVEAVFDEGGIVHSYCSCPIGGTGKCKHVAALLLTWLESPEAFFDWKDIKAKLETCEAQTLLELIDLLEDKVKASGEVIQAFSQNLTTSKSPRLAKYFRRIEEAFCVSELPWYHPDEGGLIEISFALRKIRSDADLGLQEGQLEEGIRIHQVLIQQSLNYLDDHRDRWGNLVEEIEGSVQSLQRALSCLPETNALRLKIFQILFRIIEEQLYREESIGAEEARRVILEQVRPFERDRVIAWVQALQASYQTDPIQEEREKNALEDFLIDLQRDLLEPHVYLTHYRQTGQVQKLVDSLLSLNRSFEALQVAEKEENASQAVSLATVFVKHRQEQMAEQLVLAVIKDKSNFQAWHWLKNFYRQRKANEKALQYTLKIFYFFPQFSHYQEVQDLAKQLGKWIEVRAEILSALKTLSHSSLLVEIYLDEKDITSAVATFEQSLGKQGLFKDIHHTLLALRLASAARSHYPQFALNIYQAAVRELIEERHRESYQKACDYLKLMYALYKDLQQMEVWEAYFKNLMQTYRRLKAFKDEVQRAHLLF